MIHHYSSFLLDTLRSIGPKTDKLVEFFQKYASLGTKIVLNNCTTNAPNVSAKTFAYIFGGFALIYALTGVPLDIG